MTNRAGTIGQQPYRYVIDTGLVDTIRILCDKNVHDFRFQNQVFFMLTTK